MSITLTQPQEMLHQMVTDFADKEIKPIDMLIDRERNYPEKLWQKIIETGFLSLTVPEEFGGAGFNTIASSQTIYDLASRNASMAFTLEGHYKTVDQVLKYATPALKESQPTVTLNMTKKDLASYLGTTSESLSREFTRLEREGTIEEVAYGKIKLLRSK